MIGIENSHADRVVRHLNVKQHFGNARVVAVQGRPHTRLAELGEISDYGTVVDRLMEMAAAQAAGRSRPRRHGRFPSRAAPRAVPG